jgi:nitrous oxidase accessory protein NosD
MKNKWVLMIWFGVVILATSTFGSQNSTPLKISCKDPSGCFNLLKNSIEAANAGAEIEIGPGVYYERPITINKSVTLIGVGDTIPDIIAVEGGAVIRVNSTESPIAVMMERIILRARVNDALGNLGGGGTLMGVYVNASKDNNEGKVNLTLRDVSIISNGVGVIAHGNSQVTLSNDEILAYVGAIDAEDGVSLLVENSKLVVDTYSPYHPLAVIYLHNVDADLRNNDIYDPDVSQTKMSIYGVMAIAGRFSFSGNKFSDLAAAVVIGGMTDAEISNNEFSENRVGIMLFLPPCVRPEPPFTFNGKIEGEGNTFSSSSEADLCPGLSDFSWPQNFVSSSKTQIK